MGTLRCSPTQVFDRELCSSLDSLVTMNGENGSGFARIGSQIKVMKGLDQNTNGIKQGQEFLKISKDNLLHVCHRHKLINVPVSIGL